MLCSRTSSGCWCAVATVSDLSSHVLVTLDSQAEDETPPEAPDLRKPLALRLRDVRVAVDLDSRNALWAMSDHMFAVYQLMKSMPVVVPVGAMAAPDPDLPQPPDYKARVGDEGRPQETGLLHRGSGGLRRISLFSRKAEATEADDAGGDAEDGGDLLRLILAQREVTM